MSHIGPLVVVVDIGSGIGRDHEAHREDYNPRRYGPIMPKGLKKTSETIAIGFSVIESGANTFTQGSVDMNLDPLNNEVFVVSAINLDPYICSAVAATDTRVRSSLTTTSQTAMPSLADANCLATSVNQIQAAGFLDGGCGFQQTSLDSPPATLDYLGIIATNDFFVQVQGDANLVAKGVTGKLYGYRARADASIYAALVQSEVLSA